MKNLRFTEEDARTERDVVREERRSTVDSNPLNVLGEQMLAALYLNHPYGRPVLGWAHEIERMSHADATSFYARYYAPNNATLVVAGDVTPAAVKELAAKTYAKIARGAALPESTPRAEPEPVAARRVALEHERAGTPALLRFYAVPGATNAGPGVAEALEVLAYIIGGDDTSRMHHALVGAGFAATAGANYVSNVRDSGRLALVLLPVDGVSLGRAEAVLDDLLAEIMRGGVTDDEIARAKAVLDARRTFEADNQMQLARRYGEGLSLGRSLGDIQAGGGALAAVTREAVAKAAADYLDARRSVTGTLQPPARTDSRTPASRGTP